MYTELFRDSSSSLFLGNKDKIRQLEKDIEIISLPHFLARRGYQSLLSDRKWKASEYRFFLFYTGPVTLRSTSTCIRNNFLKLSSVVYNSLCPKFNGISVNEIESGFHEWLFDFANLVGQEYISHAHHQTKHFGQFIRKHGSMGEYNEFGMESYFGRLARFVTGPFDPISQIAQRVLIDEFLRHSDLQFSSSDNLGMFWEVMDCRTLAKKGSYDEAKSIFLTKLVNITITPTTLINFQSNVDANYSSLELAVFNKSKSYLGPLNNGNYIQFINGEIGICHGFIQHNKAIFVAYKKVHCKKHRIITHSFVLLNVEETVKFKFFSHIRVPCVVIFTKSDDQKFIFPITDENEMIS